MQPFARLVLLVFAIHAAIAIGAVDEAALARDNAQCVDKLTAGDYFAAKEICGHATYEAARIAPGSRAHAASLNNMGRLYEKQGDLTQAQHLYKLALHYFQQSADAQPADIEGVRKNMAKLEGDQDRETENRPPPAPKEQARKQDVGIDDKTGAAPAVKADRTKAKSLATRVNPELNRLNRDCVEQQKAEDYVKAEKICVQAVKEAEQNAAESAAHAVSLNNLGGLYRKLARYEEAQPLYERAQEIWENALGPDHPDVGVGLNNLALLHARQGHFAKAELLYKRALAIWEKTLGPDHPQTKSVQSSLKAIRSKRGG
jgi:tetratricopeptide (TPR) repeat protein